MASLLTIHTIPKTAFRYLLG